MSRIGILLTTSSLLLAAVPAPADPPPPTPMPTAVSAPQHVTVPSLPGQPQKQGTVKLGGEVQTDGVGNVTNQPLSVDAPGSTKQAAPSGSKGAAAKAPAQGSAPAAAVPSIPVGPAPSGPATATGANYVSVKGTVTAFEAGKSITVKNQRTGKDVTYTLVPDAAVAAETKVGDTVKVRIRAAEKGKVADRVERVEKPKS